jgi:hypothetical protein
MLDCHTVLFADDRVRQYTCSIDFTASHKAVELGSPPSGRLSCRSSSYTQCPPSASSQPAAHPRHTAGPGCIQYIMVQVMAEVTSGRVQVLQPSK